MVISRLLTPAETGIFAVAAVFAAFASTFRDFGVAEFLIQEEELSSAIIRAAFTVNIAISWCMGLLLFFGASYVAEFYRSPGVADVMRVQAFNFFFIPFGAVTMAYFRRQLDFRPIFISGACSGFASFVISILCAMNGLGYMSLAWASLGAVIVSVGISFWFRPASFPKWPGLTGIGKVIQFGKFASGIYIFGQVGKGAPEMIIGRAQDLVGVAMFSRGYGIVELFNRSVLNAVTPVCLPFFAKGNRDQGSVVGGYLKSISYITVIGWPFLAFMGVFAYAIIRIVYGDQWIDAVPVAQILCFVAAIELIHHLSKEALIAAGNVKQSNSLQIGIQTARVIGLFFVIPFGLVGACFGLLAAAIFGGFLSQWNLNRTTGLKMSQVVKSCVPSAIVTVLTVVPLAIWIFIEPISDFNYLKVIFMAAPIMALLWLIALRLLRHQLWFEILGVGKGFMQRLR